MNFRRTLAIASVAAAGFVSACDDDGNNDDSDGIVTPTTYAFESTFNPGESSVGYGGQVYRHALIVDLTQTARRLDDAINQGLLSDTSAEALAGRLTYYYANEHGETASNVLPFSTTPPLAQSVYGDLASGRDLAGKIAGAPSEESTQYVDAWAEAFAGWDSSALAEDGESIATPDDLVRALIRTVAANASDFASGNARNDPTGSSSEPLPSYVTVDGQDLSQLLQKFLLGAVAYSQGTDDYLDDDVEGKGLLADNTGPRSEGAASTSLEHAWDEAFGYFGAARDYPAYTDAEIAGKATEAGARSVYFDSDGDGTIDLLTEYNFGHSTNAAKRDFGVADTGEPTDYTRQAYEGFARGRELIRLAQLDGDGALTDDEFEKLVEARDEAILAWEHAIAATVVHYINDTLGDMDAFGDEEYRFLDHAKHWSEMKGFALSLQFNPRARIQSDDFRALHEKIGMAPVLPSADESTIAGYRSALLEARDLLKQAYDFESEQVTAW